jgi:hypothetical protein
VNRLILTFFSAAIGLVAATALGLSVIVATTRDAG